MSSASENDLVLGSVVWRRDATIRQYPPHGQRSAASGPMRRPQWVEWDIRGETSRSWIILRRGFELIKDAQERFSVKMPKRLTRAEALKRGFALTAEDVEDDVWAHEHRSSILRKVTDVDAETMRKIAALIGYTEKED